MPINADAKSAPVIGGVRIHVNDMKKVFFTGLLIEPNVLGQPLPPFKGAGWDISFIEERRYPPRLRNGREIIINSKSWHRAQYALNLILSSILLYSGNPPLIEMDLVAHNDEEPEFYDPLYRKAITEKYMSTLDIPAACAIAAKVSRKRKWVYALTKYKFSTSLYGVFHVDLEPFKSSHLAVSPFPEDHVMFSHAIVSAYSAIEDLGLEVRASQKRPSRINGKWNPIVRNDLEDRLEIANINLDETILWTIRGPMRKIEKTRGLPVLENASWARGPVRDAEIKIIDAIAYSDWLRDCVASHGVKELTKVLSPYDVVNVQHLTRRLILESIGYWRWYYEKQLAF